MSFVVDFANFTRQDVSHVGGKNAYLGDLIKNLTPMGIKVPPGCAISTEAYRLFLKENNLDKKILDALADLRVDDLTALKKTSQQIRDWILAAKLPQQLINDIAKCHDDLTQNKYQLAVRSSATAEDLPEASFAGQQETYLNVVGVDNVLDAVKRVYASLFNERAIAYRTHQHIPHDDVAISVGLQRMIRSDLGVSGVTFTLDTESGFDQVVFTTATYGLGELIVQGKVNPDEYYVHKPTLRQGFESIVSRNLGSKEIKMVYSNDVEKVKIETVPTADRERFCLNDQDILKLAEYAMLIETFYKAPMDIEWAKDGIDGEIYIVQARPETVKSRAEKNQIEQYILLQPGTVLTTGSSVGQRIGQGKAKVILDINEKHLLQAGDILVTASTDPDWEPIMKLAGGIVTDHGGRTCHAAIIARELGIPAVVGCKNATKVLKSGEDITLSCAEGETGYIYQGLLEYQIAQTNVDNIPPLPVKILMNIANPKKAFAFQSIPNEGVGLARVEFIIGTMIGIHPNALINFNELDKKLQQEIQKIIAPYPSPTEFYIEKLCEGVSTIAAAFYPKPIIVRFSDFKTNEYVNLLGGPNYEPHEENPMLGYRGAYRYVTPQFKDAFALECEAIKRAREVKGLSNVHVMVPFVRTINEAQQVLEVLKSYGLSREEQGLKIYMMCEIPSNVILADEFLKLFDGFSIGSNDLTQLTLGLDRDSEQVAPLFDERDPAVKKLLQTAIQACRKQGKYIGICGQGPSDHIDFAQWLVAEGIDSMSLNPDTVLKTWLALSHATSEDKEKIRKVD